MLHDLLLLVRMFLMELCLDKQGRLVFLDMAHILLVLERNRLVLVHNPQREEHSLLEQVHTQLERKQYLDKELEHNRMVERMHLLGTLMVLELVRSQLGHSHLQVKVHNRLLEMGHSHQELGRSLGKQLERLLLQDKMEQQYQGK